MPVGWCSLYSNSVVLYCDTKYWTALIVIFIGWWAGPDGAGGRRAERRRRGRRDLALVCPTPTVSRSSLRLPFDETPIPFHASLPPLVSSLILAFTPPIAFSTALSLPFALSSSSSSRQSPSSIPLLLLVLCRPLALSPSPPPRRHLHRPSTLARLASTAHPKRLVKQEQSAIPSSTAASVLLSFRPLLSLASRSSATQRPSFSRYITRPSPHTCHLDPFLGRPASTSTLPFRSFPPFAPSNKLSLQSATLLLTVHPSVFDQTQYDGF